MTIEAKKYTLRVLLTIAAIGIMLDGITTIVGVYFGIPEGNPITGVIGLELSLIIRVVVIVLLYIIIEKADKTRELSWLILMYSSLIVIMWGTAFFNAVMIALILIFT